MRLRAKSLIGLSAITVMLSSCSLLGDRQEATKINLDEGDGDFKQLKVIKPDSNGIGGKKPVANSDMSAAKADLTKGENVSYSTQFLHPTISADLYVKEKHINFWQISDNKDFLKDTDSQPLPADLDRASYFFGLGGKLSGDLTIVRDPTDDQKSWMNYDDQKIADIRSKMIEKDPTCDGHIQSVIAAGEVAVNLNDTNIEEILNNTKIDATEGSKTLREMLKTFDPATKTEAKVSVVYFKNLADKTQTQIKGSFDPNLGTFTFSIASDIEICDSTSVQVYVIDMGQYTPIDPKDISITEENGQKKYVINLKKNVTSADIQKYKGAGNKSLEDLTFGLGDLSGSDDNTAKKDEEKKPVFNAQQAHLQRTQYIFYSNPNPSNQKTVKETPPPVKENNSDINQPTEEEKKTVAKKPAEKEQISTDAAPDANGNSNSPSGLPDQIPNQQNSNNVVVQPNNQKDNKPGSNKPSTADKTKKDQIVVTAPVTDNNPPAGIARPSDIVDRFSKTKTVAFDPRLGGIAPLFYENGVYNAGVRNADTSNYWRDYLKSNPGVYKSTKDYMTDAQVTTACKPYQFKRTINNMKINLAAQNLGDNYLNLGKSFHKVLEDQISADVDAPTAAKPGVLKNIIDAALHVPKDLSAQRWSVKLCFDAKLGLAAFWSSDELQNTYSYAGKGAPVTANTSDDNRKWLPASTKGDIGIKLTPKVSPKFNSARRSISPTLFTIRCKPNDPTHCGVIFQIGVKRIFETPRIMAYLDLDRIVDPAGGLGDRGQVIDGLRDGFSAVTIKDKTGKILQTEEKTNRLSVFVYGGFLFDSTSTSTDDTNVPYMTLGDLASQQFFVPETSEIGTYQNSLVGTITFDGALTEFYINATKGRT